MLVPFITLNRFEAGFLADWQDKVGAMSVSASFIGGPEVSKLETDLSAFLNVEHTVTCGNGTDALQLGLRALGVGEGDIVLVPDMTFWATFEAVINVGAKAVTVDIDLEDGGVDFSAFEQAIETYKPKAAIVAHLFGWGSARLADIRELCKAKSVLLLEDGAQCFGVNFNGDSIYKDALVSTTSFYPAKVFGAAGDGGAVFSRDESIANRVKQLSNHGRINHYGHGLVGWNSRMDAFQAAYLNLSRPYLASKIASRLASARAYRAQLKHPKLRVLSPSRDYEENGYCNVCLIEDLDFKARLEAHLREQDIGFGNIYPGPMSKQPGAGTHLVGSVGGEKAATWCASVLNLPLFPYMRVDEIETVVSHVNNFK